MYSIIVSFDQKQRMPSDFQADGERTGKYILAGDNMTVNAKGESIISYADYAIALVDEIVSGNHIQERISLVRE